MEKQDPQQTASPPSATPDLWRSFRDEFDRLFDRFTIAPWSFPMLRRHTAPPGSWPTAAAPLVDVAEDDHQYTIAAELPGLTEKDVDVFIDGANLVIRGEKRNEAKTEGKNYHLIERAYGTFERRFFLPENVDQTQIRAEVAKGVLTIILPKTAAAKETTKKIEVKPA